MLSKKKAEVEINVKLDEPLTNDLCTKLVIEIIKYVLYQKQQIPFAYDSLVQFQKSAAPTNKNIVSFKDLSNTLKNISDQISSQFFREGCDIREVAIILGTTLMTAKLYVGIEFPSYILNSKQHKEYQHSSRKPLIKLMRSMLDCEKFQETLTVPLNVTNTFVILKKSDRDTVLEQFIFKPQFVPPVETTSCFKIKLCHDNQVDIPCTCNTLVTVYNDFYESNFENEDDVQYSKYNSSSQSSYHWYQLKPIIRGFNFCLQS